VAARRQEEFDSLVADIAARGGPCTSSTAFWGQFAGITDLAEDEWDRVLGINLKGTYLGMKYQGLSTPQCIAGCDENSAMKCTTRECCRASIFAAPARIVKYDRKATSYTSGSSWGA